MGRSLQKSDGPVHLGMLLASPLAVAAARREWDSALAHPLFAAAVARLRALRISDAPYSRPMAKVRSSFEQHAAPMDASRTVADATCIE